MTDHFGLHLNVSVFEHEGKFTLVMEGFTEQAQVDAVLEAMNRGGMTERKTTQ